MAEIAWIVYEGGRTTLALEFSGAKLDPRC